jgi:hypothetical protein
MLAKIIKAIDKRLKIMCLRGLRKKYEPSLKSLKKGVGSRSVSQRYGSAPKCHRSTTLLTAEHWYFEEP